jgi:hypothetical protein
MTLTGRDPKGETIVAENRAALDLVPFDHDPPTTRRDEFTPDTRSTSVRTTRTIFGVAYHLGTGADVLLDADELTYGGTVKPSDERTQLTLQIKFCAQRASVRPPCAGIPRHVAPLADNGGQPPSRLAAG